MLDFQWIYDLAHWQFCSLMISLFVAVALIGQLATRKVLRRTLGGKDYNDLVGQYLSAFGVLYGITLGLISVGAWENFADVEGKVSTEAAAVGVLYLNVDSFPEPQRSELTTLLREYTRYVIDDAWPEQRRGIIPSDGSKYIVRLQRALGNFEPVTEGKKSLHREALHQFNSMVESRRLRLDSVTARLPTILWFVVFAGSFLSLALTWLFVVDNTLLHDLLTASLAALLGLLIFLLAVLDLPFRGQHSVGPDSFELVYDRMMKS